MAFRNGGERVKQLTTTTGTGNLTLGAALAAYQAVGDVVSNGDTLNFLIEAVDTNGAPTGAWEMARGVYTSSGTTLTRSRVYASSNSGSAVNFIAGNKHVSIVPAFAEDNAIAIIHEEQTPGTDGGGASSGSWFDRVLNTTQSDPNGLVTLNASTGEFKLPAGEYEINAWAVGYAVASHTIRLRNTVTNQTLGVGNAAVADATNPKTAISRMCARFEIAAATDTLFLQQRTTATKTTDGRGKASNVGEAEIYALARIQRVG